jgi:hypothetical protein
MGSIAGEATGQLLLLLLLLLPLSWLRPLLRASPHVTCGASWRWCYWCSGTITY